MNFTKIVEEALDDPDMRDDTGYSGPARRVAKIVILNKDGGYNSAVTLDTDKLDNIGWTKKSLADYVEDVFMSGRPNLMWYTSSDKVMPLRRRRR